MIRESFLLALKRKCTYSYDVGSVNQVNSPFFSTFCIVQRWRNCSVCSGAWRDLGWSCQNKFRKSGRRLPCMAVKSRLDNCIVIVNIPICNLFQIVTYPIRLFVKGIDSGMLLMKTRRGHFLLQEAIIDTWWTPKPCGEFK